MTTASDTVASRVRTRRWPRLQRFFRHRLAVFGAATIAFMTIACIVGPHLVPYTDTYIDIRNRFAPPLSGPHILGTDPLGELAPEPGAWVHRVELHVPERVALDRATAGLDRGDDVLHAGALRQEDVDAADLVHHRSQARRLGVEVDRELRHVDGVDLPALGPQAR